MPRHVRILLAAGMVTSCLLAGAGMSATSYGPAGGAPTGHPGPTDAPDPIRAIGLQTLTGSPDEAPTLTLAFAGDVHFAGRQANLPDDPAATLGPMSATLAAADLAMVNLESAITDDPDPDARTRKELEDPDNRYWFATAPSALDLVARSGVDVVSMANNHGADYGVDGLGDTLAAAESGPIPIVGVGRTDRDAYAPYRTRVKGADIAIHAADASPRESADAIWAAVPGSGPGLASARDEGATAGGLRALTAAVRTSAATDDLVVVYLHWGEEGNACATPDQQRIAEILADAGADIVVGSHAHTLLGAGILGPTYVSYGLGNFFWYHGGQPDSGVLTLSVQDGEVVAEDWTPGTIAAEGGGPTPLPGAEADTAVRRWEELRGCTDLAPGPGPTSAVTERADDPARREGEGDSLPSYAASIQEIGPDLAATMTAHDPARCPVAIGDLSQVEVTYVGFDGRAHRGELVVHADVAADVVDVFAALYEERFPIERMRLIDEYAGDDFASMAANNTSAYNCRHVAGTTTWSTHAYAVAIDINPVQNPYVLDGQVLPPGGESYATLDRSAGADVPPGVIRDGDVARRAFEQIGWEWGGDYTEPDYQHFNAPDLP